MGNSNSGGFGSRSKNKPIYCDAACLRRVCQEIVPPGRKNNRGIFRGGGGGSNGSRGSKKGNEIYVPGPQFQGLMLPQNHYDEVYSKIYLGDNTLPRHPKECKELGITHVLNSAQGNRFGQVDTNENLYTPYGLHFYGIEAQDNEKYNLASHFYKAADFIESGTQGGRVLVHCVQGISRSATIVCAFLMIKKGMTAEQAMKTVRSKREIFPNQGFLRQLCELNDRLQAEKLIEKSLSRTPSICSDLLKNHSPKSAASGGSPAAATGLAKSASTSSAAGRTKKATTSSSSSSSKLSHHHSFLLKGPQSGVGGFSLRRHSSSRSKTVSESLSASADAIKVAHRKSAACAPAADPTSSKETSVAPKDRASFPTENQMKGRASPVAKSFTASSVHQLDVETSSEDRNGRENRPPTPSISPSLPNISQAREIDPGEFTQNIKTEGTTLGQDANDDDDNHEAGTGDGNKTEESEHLRVIATAQVHDICNHIPNEAKKGELSPPLVEIETATGKMEEKEEEQNKRASHEHPVDVNEIEVDDLVASSSLKIGIDSPSTLSNSNTASSLSSSPSTSQSITVMHDPEVASGAELSLPPRVADQVSVNSNKSKNVIQTQINRLILLPDFEH